MIIADGEERVECDSCHAYDSPGDWFYGTEEDALAAGWEFHAGVMMCPDCAEWWRNDEPGSTATPIETPDENKPE